MLPGPAELERLAHKYRQLAALRRERAAGAQPPPAHVFKALAGEFPGALQELDTLPLDVIDTRAADLARAARGGEMAPWMAWLHGYHALMRAALRVKLRLRGRREVPDELACSLAAEAAQIAGCDLDDRFVRSVARPPDGRIGAVVFEILARQFGQDASTVGDAVFPARVLRRARRASNP
jgi:hypothetical protein